MKQTHLKDYYLTPSGKLYSNRNNRGLLLEVQPQINKCGYAYANVYYDKGKRTYIRLHRWVWETFICKIPKGYEIHHKDHNKLNNSLENLAMVTHSDNMKLYYQHKREQKLCV